MGGSFAGGKQHHPAWISTDSLPVFPAATATNQVAIGQAGTSFLGNLAGLGFANGSTTITAAPRPQVVHQQVTLPADAHVMLYSGVGGGGGGESSGK